jgi:predicted DNA binding protein
MEHITVLSIVPAVKANGRVKFTVSQNNAQTFDFELTEAQADALRLAIVSALA